MKSDLLSYALDFTSFFLQKSKYKFTIVEIILFGSVAREEASLESDVDIFVNVLGNEKKIEKEGRKIVQEFKESTKCRNYWKLLGVANDIKIVVGQLKQWKELEPSIISNGIVLYGKFKPSVTKGKHSTFLIWENVKPNSKRVLLNKQLLGYTFNKKFYNGLLQKYGGEKLGKGCIIIPVEHTLVFLSLFRKYNAAVKIKKVVEFT